MKSYKKHFDIKSSPANVYAAFTNQQMIELWTGEPATMSTEVDSEFSWFDDDICGINRSFTQDKQIVQDWYFGEDHLSSVTINIFPNKNNSQIEIIQTNIPDDDYDNIAEGWQDAIIDALKELIED